MKTFNLLMAVLTFFLVVNINAQNETNKWYISVGAQGINYTAARPVFNGYFDINDYSLVPPLSKITVARNLSKRFNVDFEAGFGQVDDKRLNIKDEFYSLVGLGLRYQLIQKSWVDFYLRGAANYHRYDYEQVSFPYYGPNDGTDGEYPGLEQPVDPQNNNFAVTFGAGFNFWFGKSKTFGLNLESNYVWLPAFPQDYFNHFQNSLGLTFRFGNNDYDGDGIPNDEDACPETPGVAACNGCPDTDGDGVCDDVDQCPDTPGTAACNGCPDTDGDGVCDNVDQCPDTPGPAANNGCPWPDMDQDGIPDNQDACPDTWGEPNSDPKLNGCPVPAETAIDNTAVKEIRRLAGEVNFEFNKDILQEASKTKLNEVAMKMNQDYFKDYNWLVEGHTDSKGSDSYNMKLSQDRAQAVVNYLVSKGVSASRLKPIGYGETVPQMSNATDAGRAVNRRVEIKPADASFNPTALILDSSSADQEIADLAKFIFFVTGKDQLQEGSKAQLVVVSQYMKQYPNNKYEIGGYTDNTGSDAINNKLSQDRAQSVVNFLVSQGVNAANLTAKGYGSSNPRASNDTEEGRAENRRVEIKRVN